MLAFKDLFTKHLRLKRDEQGFRVVFEGAAAPAPAREAAAGKSAPEPSRLMCGELTALLDQAAGSRRVVRHLAAIEHELRHRDATGLFIFEQPASRLKTALRELDTLVGATAPSGLAALRGQLVAAIAAHESRERETPLQQPLSSFLTDEKLSVNEVRHTDFEQASAAWLEPAPGGKTPPTS